MAARNLLSKSLDMEAFLHNQGVPNGYEGIVKHSNVSSILNGNLRKMKKFSILEPDIVDRMQKEFSTTDFPTALTLLGESGNVGRIARCIVVAAKGSVDSLPRLIKMAAQDYRDVIFAAEYNRDMQRVRDLRISFLIDLPIDAWITDIAMFLDSRELHLDSLETQKTTLGPFNSPQDQGEGSAIFKGSDRTMTISKQNRKWRALGNEAELKKYQLHQEYDDLEQFKNQLTWLLSGRAL